MSEASPPDRKAGHIRVAVYWRAVEPRMHKVACANCPSAHFPPDEEVLDIMKLPKSQKLETAFPCGWNGRRYCRGYCLLMGITDADLLAKTE